MAFTEKFHAAVQIKLLKCYVGCLCSGRIVLCASKGKEYLESCCWHWHIRFLESSLAESRCFSLGSGDSWLGTTRKLKLRSSISLCIFIVLKLWVRFLLNSVGKVVNHSRNTCLTHYEVD